MFRRLSKILLRSLSPLLALGFILLVIPRMIASLSTASRRFSVGTVPARRVAIVFGAGLWRDGSPTPILRDRVETATALYHAGKVEKLLMSGDNRFVDYNEPAAMRGYALELGVPENDIVLDYAGRRTYDTCYRAKEIFGVSQPVLVTQDFHLARALYICNALGLDAVGVAAQNRWYAASNLIYWNLRELPATLAAFWEVNVTHPLPVLGQREPIFAPEAQ